MSRAASPSRRSHHGRVLFSARTLLFFVDPEKSCLGATVRQRRIVAKIRRTKHHRRQYIYTTGADSSGSFLRRTCQTLNASKSVRIWTPNRAEVDRCDPYYHTEPYPGTVVLSQGELVERFSLVQSYTAVLKHTPLPPPPSAVYEHTAHSELL